MRSYIFPLVIFILFGLSAFYLTLRQEILLKEANQELVSAAYVDPRNVDDASFFVEHASATPRPLTIDYRYPDQTTKTETLTLQPYEKRFLSPADGALPVSIVIRYTDAHGQEQLLTLTKRQ